MPKAKHHDAIARQWEILNLIPTRSPGKTVTEIVTILDGIGIKTTQRTIQRDLIELSTIFGIVCNDESKPYRWQWMSGKGVELPSLTLTDALSLKIAEEILRPLLPKAIIETLEYRFQEANIRLNQLPGNNKNSSWLNKIRNVTPTLSLISPVINEDVLIKVQTALLNDKRIEIEYQAFEQKDAGTQILNPLALVQRGASTYLVATAYEYTDPRLYAMHRIHSANELAESVIKPNKFSIDEYISQGALNFGSGKKIKLEANISDWLCKILQETPISNDQCIIEGDDEEAKLKASVEDTWQLRWWILSQASGIEVIKPKSLRKAIRNDLLDAAEQYQD